MKYSGINTRATSYVRFSSGRGVRAPVYTTHSVHSPSPPWPVQQTVRADGRSKCPSDAGRSSAAAGRWRGVCAVPFLPNHLYLFSFSSKRSAPCTPPRCTQQRSASLSPVLPPPRTAPVLPPVRSLPVGAPGANLPCTRCYVAWGHTTTFWVCCVPASRPPLPKGRLSRLRSHARPSDVGHRDARWSRT